MYVAVVAITLASCIQSCTLLPVPTTQVLSQYSRLYLLYFGSGTQHHDPKNCRLLTSFRVQRIAQILADCWLWA